MATVRLFCGQHISCILCGWRIKGIPHDRLGWGVDLLSTYCRNFTISHRTQLMTEPDFIWATRGRPSQWDEI